MPVKLGAHSPRIAVARSLAAPKGRREHGLFAFEGPTLLDEARRAGLAVTELYATEAALGRYPAAGELERHGTEVFLVDDRTAAKLSEVESPTGLVAVAKIRLESPGALLARPGLVLVMAGLNDPGNAGTLLRSADAFGASGVIFGLPGVDPYNPKVVRAAMGSLFRVPLGTAEPQEVAAAAAGRPILGLAGDGEPLGASVAPNAVIIVGHERSGLGLWEAICTKRVAIPMRGGAESLNAAVAGSIALFEAAKGGF